MKLSELIKSLQFIQESHKVCDPEVQLQNDPKDGEMVISIPDFFIAEEEYEDGWKVNLRTWPY